MARDNVVTMNDFFTFVQALKKDAVTFMRECSNMKFTVGDIESGVKMLERLRR